MLIVYLALHDSREQWFMQGHGLSVPATYHRRVSRMTNDRARARTLAGLWLLAQGLDILGLPAERLQRIGFSARGKPELAAGPHFSISHSTGLVACALDSRSPIGLDVEQRRDDVSPRLQQAIAAPDEDFFAAWCAREAVVKASGRVGLARVKAVQLTRENAWLDGRYWHLQALALVPDHSACIASTEPIMPEAVRVVDCAERVSGVRVQ